MGRRTRTGRRGADDGRDGLQGPAKALRQPGTYRVEHRRLGGATVLAASERCFAHHRALDPYASYLVLGGVTDGELVLVEDATGEVVARRRMTPR